MSFLSIVVPVYKEERSILPFIQSIVPVLVRSSFDFEIIFALDPSPDQTESVILEERRKDSRIKLLTLSRRFGQPAASLAGLSYASGDAVVVIDVDLQDPPELILEMLKKWKEGFEVVYAQRKVRAGETLLKRLVSYLGYKFINRIAEVEIPPNTGDFRLMSRRVVNEVLSLKECHGFLRGMVALVGFKQTSVLFDRPKRYAGKGNYNRYFGSIRIGMNGIVCFSNYLLRFSSFFGFFLAMISLLLGSVYFIMKMRGFPFPIGNPTIVILILFLGGVQLISVGVLSEYISRIYDEVKERPKFIVERKEGFD